MFRVILYALLGFVIAGIFSPIIPQLSNQAWGMISGIGAIFGAGIGFRLNRILGVQPIAHPEGLVDYWEDRSILPASQRRRYYNWLRSKFGVPPRP